MISVQVASLEAIPSTTEHGADGIWTALQQVRHVVGLVLDSPVIAGPSRSEELIAYAFPVQVQLVKTVACDVRTRLLNDAGADPAHLEFTAQHGSRTAGYVI